MDEMPRAPSKMNKSVGAPCHDLEQGRACSAKGIRLILHAVVFDVSTQWNANACKLVFN
jgi:hypothetical protein